jgi:hypothetical protein
MKVYDFSINDIYLTRPGYKIRLNQTWQYKKLDLIYPRKFLY